MYAALEQPGRDCSVFRTVEAVGDAWSWLVLREAIIDDVRRFDDFQARLGIARATLSARLNRLCDAGLLERRGQDYALTQPGADFFGCLMTAMRWGDQWCAGGGAVPVQTMHTGCGHPMHAELRCACCRKPVHAREVIFDRRPAPVAGQSATAQRHRMPGLDLLERGRPCSAARTLQFIGDRWSALVIQECFYGIRRFDDFQRRLGIATNILAQRLARLVDHGMLARAAYRSQPLRHEYRLTDQGLDLYPVPLAMLTWGDRWLAGRPPITLTHRACGENLAAVLACSECGEPIQRADVIFTPAL
jgi:DNA-binding HxlR family transcriptional regulator